MTDGKKQMVEVGETKKKIFVSGETAVITHSTSFAQNKFTTHIILILASYLKLDPCQTHSEDRYVHLFFLF